MKKVMSIVLLSLLSCMLFAEKIPANRQLFVGVWKYEQANHYKDISKYEKYVERFLKDEIYSDLKMNAKTGELSYEKSFDFEKGNCLDIDNDEYRFLTCQIDKVLLSYQLHIFDWTVTKNGNELKVKFNNALLAAVDKNGNWTNNSSFKKSSIMNVKQIEENVAKDIMSYLNVSDSEYESYRDSVVTDTDFLCCVVPNMTELGLEDFIDEYKPLGKKSNFTFNVVEVKKNDSNREGLTAADYEYYILGSISRKCRISGYSNGKLFNKAKKGTEFTCEGILRSIEQDKFSSGFSFAFTVD